MSPIDECQLCTEFNFNYCGVKFPCTKLISEQKILGLAYKPNTDNDPITKNSEARFIEFSESQNEKFYFSAFKLAEKTKLFPVTTFEMNVLGRQIRDENFRSKYFHDSEENYILIPESWAMEIRTILKYLLRLHTQDFYLSFKFIEEVSMTVDPLRPLKYDKSKYFLQIKAYKNLEL